MLVFTPDHAANHICLVLVEDGLLFSGDPMQDWVELANDDTPQQARRNRIRSMPDAWGARHHE